MIKSFYAVVVHAAVMCSGRLVEMAGVVVADGQDVVAHFNLARPADITM